MKLLVPFRMACSDWIWFADRHWLMLAMMGIPPATEARYLRLELIPPREGSLRVGRVAVTVHQVR